MPERLHVAYADPPYFGSCRMYKHHHPDGLCWDDPATHEALVRRLEDEYPDGWALSLTSNSLRMYLPWCPSDVRIAAWVKRTAVYKKGVNPTYAWEPLIYRGADEAISELNPRCSFSTGWTALSLSSKTTLGASCPERSHASSATGCSTCLGLSPVTN